MVITEKMYLYNDILLDNKTALRTISSQLTAHSSLSLILIKTIFYFTIQYILTLRAVSDFFPSALFLCLIDSLSC